jgi:hypothetical protein
VVVELLLASALASPLEFELWLFWKNGIRILLLRVCDSLRGVAGKGPAVATPHISSGLYDMQVGIDENRLERGWSQRGLHIDRIESDSRHGSGFGWQLDNQSHTSSVNNQIILLAN